MFEVTVKVSVSAETKEAAKEAALDHFAKMEDIKDEEIVEVNNA